MKINDLLILAAAAAVLFVVVRKVAAKAPAAVSRGGLPASYAGNVYDPSGMYGFTPEWLSQNYNSDNYG